MLSPNASNGQEENLSFSEALESEGSTVKHLDISVQSIRTAQLRIYEFEEEKQAWMLLVRQAILDCQYLDKAAEECLVPAALLSTSFSTAASTISPMPRRDQPVSGIVPAAHSATFAHIILEILDAHNKIAFTRSVSALMNSFVFLSTSELAGICDMRTSLPGNSDINPFSGKNTMKIRSNSNISLPSSESDSRSISLYPDPYLARTAVGQRTALMKNILDRLGDLIISCFSDICGDYRPTIEIYTVSTCIISTDSNEGEGSACYSSLLVQDFIHSFCTTLERTAGVSTGDFQKLWNARNRGNKEDENKFQV